jgi:hypothetical protein
MDHIYPCGFSIKSNTSFAVAHFDFSLFSFSHSLIACGHRPLWPFITLIQSIGLYLFVLDDVFAGSKDGGLRARRAFGSALHPRHGPKDKSLRNTSTTSYSSRGIYPTQRQPSGSLSSIQSALAAKYVSRDVHAIVIVIVLILQFLAVSTVKLVASFVSISICAVDSISRQRDTSETRDAGVTLPSHHSRLVTTISHSRARLESDGIIQPSSKS